MLQFVYAIVLVTNWSILARRSLGEKAVNPEVFRRSVLLITAFSIPALMFYPAFAAFSDKQHDAYRFLQYGIVLPTLMFAVSLLSNALKLRRPSQWPWRNSAFVALATSLALFAVGGAMGMLVTGSDTRTPAHYHDVITAVSVSGMGVLLTFALDEMKRLPASERTTRIILMLYGGGQIVASIGMFNQPRTIEHDDFRRFPGSSVRCRQPVTSRSSASTAGSGTAFRPATRSPTLPITLPTSRRTRPLGSFRKHNRPREGGRTNPVRPPPARPPPVRSTD